MEPAGGQREEEGRVMQAHTSAQTLLWETSQLADGVGVRRQSAVSRHKRAYNGIRLNVTE